MRMNKYLASTLFTGLFITASVFSPAQGQEQSLQPQGAWAITKVDRSAQGGNSYCTLSRKYDDGVVLSLGRNQTEEYSLAIDFQKETFAKDKALKINLQPGPGQIRAYDMMPTSDKAVVIRLGWDTGFFDALNQSQNMKVKLGDKQFAFAMPEIAKGQDELQECMEGLKSAAKGGGDTQTKDVLNAHAGQSSKDFDAAKSEEKVASSAGALNADRQKLDAQEKGVLAGFAANIKAKEAAANNDNSAPRKNFAKVAQNDSDNDRKTKVPAPSMADDGLTSADNLAAASIASADVVTNTAPAKKPEPEMVKRPAPSKDKDVAVAEKVAATSPSAAFEANDKEIAALQKRIADMNAENADLKQKSTGVAPETQKQIDALAADKKALQDKLAAAEKERDTKANPQDLVVLQSKAKELEIKNAQLEDSLRQSQTRIAETAVNTETKSMKTIVDLQTKLEAAQKDNTVLAKQMESYKLQQEDGRLSVVAGDWDLEQATKRYNEAEREIRRLGLQLEQERTNCNREKAQIEDMLFDPAVADQKQIERLSQLQKDLDMANAKIADNQKLVQGAVDQQLAAKTQSIAAEKDNLAQQVASLQKTLADKDAAAAAEKATLQNQMAALQKSTTDSKAALADKAVLSQQVASLQKTLADKDAAAASEKTALQNQLSTLQKSAADSQTAIADKTILAQQVANLQKSLTEKDAALTAEKTAMQAQIASLQKSLNDKEGAVVAEKTTMQAQIASLQKSLSDKEGAVVAEKTNMQTQIASLQKSLSDKEGAVGAEKTSMQNQIASLQKSLNEKDGAATAEKTAMQNQMAVLQQQAASSQTANAEKERLNQQVAEMKKTLAAKDTAVASEKISFQTQIDTLKSSLTQKDQELYALKAQPKIDPVAADQRVAQEVGKARAAADQEIIALKTAMAAKDQQIAAAQAVPKIDPAVTKQLADLQAFTATVKKENETLRDQNIVLNQNAEKLRLQLADIQTNGSTRADQVASMQLQMDEIKRQTEMKDRATATYQNQLASLQQDNAQLKAHLSVADTDRGNSTSEVNDLTRQVQSLQSQISDLRRNQAQQVNERSVSATRLDRIAPAAGFVQSAAVPVMPVTAQPIAARVTASPVQSPAPTGMGGYDKDSIQSLLKKSGISPAGLQKASSGFVDSDNFAWADNSVKGLASVKTLGGTDFDTMVNQYIAYQKGQCGGDFASMPSPTNGSAAKRMSLYEIACVSPSQSLSSSLIFFEDQGRFIAISNQINAADMDIAMDSRDRIAGFVRGL